MVREIEPSIQERLNKFQIGIERTVDLYIIRNEKDVPNISNPFEDIYYPVNRLIQLMNCVEESKEVNQESKEEIIKIISKNQYEHPHLLIKLHDQSRSYLGSFSFIVGQTNNWDFQKGLSIAAQEKNRKSTIDEIVSLSKSRITCENFQSLIDKARLIQETYMDIVSSRRDRSYPDRIDHGK